MKINKEVLGRIENLPKKHPLRKRLMKEMGKVPSRKSILGGLLLGLIGLLVYVGWDTALNLPFVVFIAAIMAGMLCAHVRLHHRSAQRGQLWILIAVLPLAMSVWAASFGNRHYYASHVAYTAGEQLNALHGNTAGIFEEPGSVHYVASQFQMALDLVPRNPTALLGLGNSQLAYLEARLESSQEVARRAVVPLSEARNLAPESWLASFSLARAMAILGAPQPEVTALLRQAVDHAPYRPEPAALLGSLLLLDNPRSPEGMELLQGALALNPDYLPAINALRRNRIRSGELNAQTDTPASSTVTPAILAEQFRLLPHAPDRVSGAGLPRPEKGPVSMIES